MQAVQAAKLLHKVEQPVGKGTVKLAKFEDSIKYANFFYLTIGIQPYEDLERDTKKGKTFLPNLVLGIQIGIINMVMSTEIAFVVLSFVRGTDFIEATYAMSYISFATVSMCKMLFVWKQKSVLTKFVADMKNIFPQHKDLQRDYDLEQHLGRCSAITLVYSVLYMILIWTYNLMGIVKYIVCGALLGMEGVKKTLPFIVYLPWEWQNDWSYYVVYACHDLAGYTSAAGHISTDLFLMACTSQLIMHFHYLAKQITHFHCSPNFNRNVEFLKDSILYHANLLNLCEELNRVFGVPLFLNLISSAFVICFVGFQITIGASPETMVKLILFFVSSAAEVYLICHFGQQLLDISTSVANAVYNQNWYSADVRFQKMLVLMAQRAQQPAQLKATKFILVSLNTFSELMQISYKFFTLLNTMYGD